MKQSTLNKLHELYQKENIKAGKRLLEDPDILYLINMTKEIYLFGNKICKTEEFNQYYEKHLKGIEKAEDLK